MEDQTILEYWKENETRFPTLARMARDFLAIAGSTVDLERFFSWARDICHYRRGRLLPTTIRAIMLYMISKNMQIRKDLEPDDMFNRDDSDDDGDNHSDRHIYDYISDDESDALDHAPLPSHIPCNPPAGPAPMPPRDSPTDPAPVSSHSPSTSASSSTHKRQHEDEEKENSTVTQRPVRKRRTTKHPDYISH